MASKPEVLTPLTVVVAALSIIEVAISVLYPQLQSTWEKIPVLIVIVLLPLLVIGAFAYLWIKKPGHLFPPSEFGTGESARVKLNAYSCPACGDIPHKPGEPPCPACGR